MYAKLEDGVLQYAPKKVVYNGCIVFNPTVEILITLGYLLVETTNMPTDAPEGKKYVSSWKQQSNKIIQIWTLIDAPVTEQTLEERVDYIEETLKIIGGGRE